jgi:hypothetical protein
MRRLARHRPSPAIVISLIALFVALSGVAVALPGKNRLDRNDPKRGSIGSRAIANNSIRTGDIRANNVQTSDLLDGSVTGEDVNEATLGTVPRSTRANLAAQATKAQSAASAVNAVNAANAANADALDGVDSSGYLRTSFNRIRSVGNSAVANYGNNAPLAQLVNLPRGTYGVTAKLTVFNDSASPEVVTCQLVRSVATSVVDSNRQTLGPSLGAAQQLDFALIAQVSTSSAGTDDIYLRCTNPAGDNDAEDVKILTYLEGN